MSGKVWNITPTSSPSLAQAELQAQPGDTVLLNGKFVNTSLVPRISGTPLAPVTYKAGPLGATFDGAGPSGVAAFNSRAYIVLDGIKLTNSQYVAHPVSNKGVVLRGSNHITIQNCDLSYMQMQLIGSSDNTIIKNKWREFVSVYVNGQPQTSGDMLNLVSGSHRNLIQFNDMKYAGHSLIEIGNGWGPPNAANKVLNNILSNPWYKCLILADDGAGTIVDTNDLLDANSVPTLLATVPYPSASRWPKDGKAYANPALQLDGKNYIFRNNTIDNAVSIYGTISMGARWYYGQGAPIGGTLVEPKNNQVYGNRIQNCKSVATFSFEQNYTPGKDLSVPNIMGNLIYDNAIINPQSTIYSWDGTAHYETVFFREFKGAPVWVGLNGNQFYDNVGVSPSNAYRRSYVNAAGMTTVNVYTLAQFEALDPIHINGNS